MPKAGRERERDFWHCLGNKKVIPPSLSLYSTLTQPHLSLLKMLSIHFPPLSSPPLRSKSEGRTKGEKVPLAGLRRDLCLTLYKSRVCPFHHPHRMCQKTNAHLKPVKKLEDRKKEGREI